MVMAAQVIERWAEVPSHEARWEARELRVSSAAAWGQWPVSSCVGARRRTGPCMETSSRSRYACGRPCPDVGTSLRQGGGAAGKLRMVVFVSCVVAAPSPWLLRCPSTLRRSLVRSRCGAQLLPKALWVRPGSVDDAVHALRAELRAAAGLGWVETIDVEQALCEFAKYVAYCTTGISASKRYVRAA